MVGKVSKGSQGKNRTKIQVKTKQNKTRSNKTELERKRDYFIVMKETKTQVATQRIQTSSALYDLSEISFVCTIVFILHYAYDARCIRKKKKRRCCYVDGNHSFNTRAYPVGRNLFLYNHLFVSLRVVVCLHCPYRYPSQRYRVTDSLRC